ncbi:MAG: efflux RND transporter periplasmic adaptor subunit [Bradymonadia bacterium]|jgi:multidrug efflux system membrane fusion protein
MRRAGLWALLLVIGGCKDASGPPAGGSGAPGAMGKAAQSFPVEVTTVASRTLGFSGRAVGTLEPFERVQVTARVAGAVDAVRFREGDRVSRGDVLVEVDTARFALVARSAKARVDRARAALGEAETGLARREAAEKASPGLVKGEELETWRSRVLTARADVAVAEVDVDRALLDQRDAAIRAPMDGVVETRDVRTGQYAQAGTLVATLLRREPLLLRFALPEAETGTLRPGGQVRFSVAGAVGGRLATVRHIAGTADPQTRMVPIVADVAPSAEGDAPLVAGAFAEVDVPLGAEREATVIPQSAMRASEKGFLAYVVDGEVARERILTLGQRTPDGAVEVKSGLTLGERLVVRGAEALREGASVRVVEARAPGGAVAPESRP